jgi:hypothetical protein
MAHYGTSPDDHILMAYGKTVFLTDGVMRQSRPATPSRQNANRAPKKSTTPGKGSGTQELDFPGPPDSAFSPRQLKSITVAYTKYLDMMLVSPLSSVGEAWRKTISDSKPIKPPAKDTPRKGFQWPPTPRGENHGYNFIGNVKEGDTFTDFGPH